MNTTTRTADRLPAALYAAAGAGELAYEQLRKLPSTLTALRGQLGSLDRDQFDVRRLDVAQLRQVARRNASALVTSAEHGRDRAIALYADLVARGEKVVGRSRAAAKAASVTPISVHRPATEPAASARRAAVASRRPRPAGTTTKVGTAAARKPRTGIAK